MRLIDADELKKECRSVPDPRGKYAELRIIEDYEIDDASTIFEISDNATNGEVIKAIFGYKRISHFNDNPPLVDVYGLDNNDDTDAVTFYEEWWNSPYKKGGNDESRGY